VITNVSSFPAVNRKKQSRKCGNCDALQLEAARRRSSRYPLKLRLPYQGLTRLTYPFLPYSAFTANKLRYVVILIFDPVTLNFGLCPWIHLMHRMWPDQSLYQIWAKSSNRRRSYCDFIICPYDVEHSHMLLYALRKSAQVRTPLTYRFLTYSFLWGWYVI